MRCPCTVCASVRADPPLRPQNLLFRNAVVEYQDAVRDGNADKARAKCSEIVDVFMGTDSVLEIPTRKSMQAQATAGELTLDMFDEALQTIDRDLVCVAVAVRCGAVAHVGTVQARSLQAFYEIPAFRSVMKVRTKRTTRVVTVCV